MRNYPHPYHQQQMRELAERTYVQNNLDDKVPKDNSHKIGYDFMRNRFSPTDHISQDVNPIKSNPSAFVNSLPRHAGYPISMENAPVELKNHVNLALKKLTDPYIANDYSPTDSKPWSKEKERWRILAGIPTRDEFPFKPNIQWAAEMAPLRNPGGPFFGNDGSSVCSRRTSSTSLTGSKQNSKNKISKHIPGRLYELDSEASSAVRGRGTRILHKLTGSSNEMISCSHRARPAGITSPLPLSKEGRVVYNPVTHEAAVFKSHSEDGYPVLVAKYGCEASQSIIPLVGSSDHHGIHAKSHDPLGFRITKGVSQLKDMANPFLGNYNKEHAQVKSFALKQGDFAKHFDAGIRCGMKPI